MDEPEWADLLQQYYLNGGWMYNITLDHVSHPDLPGENNLATYLPNNEDYEIQNELFRAGLVEEVELADLGSRKAHAKDHTLWYGLTEKGFKVAHERELKSRETKLLESQNKSNDTMVVFTVVLGISAIIQAISNVIKLDQYQFSVSAVFISLLLLAVVITIERSPERY